MSLDAYKNDTEGLRRYLKKFKTTVVRTEYPFVTVGGEFEEDGNIIIHIFGEYERKCFDNDEWFMFKFRLIQTMMHELVHWRQHEKRGHGYSRVLKYVSDHHEARYYSTVDEIVAYAHCAYLELQRDHPGLSVGDVQDHGGETHDHMFNVVFENDHRNEALGRFLREIVRWERRYVSYK